MSVLRYVIALSCLLAVSVHARAEWTGRGEAGVAFANGNAGAKTTTVNGRFDLALKLVSWEHAFGGAGVYASSRDENDVKSTTANRWEAHQQSDFRFSERGFWFESQRHEMDGVGSFEYQYAATTGLGYRLSDTERIKSSAQLGVGYKRLKPRMEAVESLPAEEDFIGTFTFGHQHSLTDNTSIIERLIVEAGATNVAAQNSLALQVKMLDVLALAVGYQVRYNSEPGMRSETAPFENMTDWQPPIWSTNFSDVFLHTASDAALRTVELDIHAAARL